MNKRLEELAEQANVQITKQCPITSQVYSYYEFSQEKFAELLVKECITVNADTNKFLSGEATRLASKVPAYKTVMKSYETIFNINLKRHFGVEE